MKLSLLRVLLGLSFGSGFYSSVSVAQGLVESFQKAQVNAPDYQVKAYALQAIRSKADKTQAGYFPTIDFDASYTYNWQEVLRSESGVFPEDNVDYSSNNMALTLKQKIYDGGLLAQLKKSDYELRQSQFQLRASEQELMYQVAESYFSVLAAEDQLGLSQAEAKAIQSQYEITQVKYQKGLANLLEWQEIQSRQAEAKANVSEAQMGVYAAQYRLKQLTGENSASLDKLQEAFNEKVLALAVENNYLDEAFEKNLSLQAQREAIVTAAQEVTVQTRGHYPTVDFSLTASRDDADGSLYGGGNKINDYKAKLSLNVPIYHGGFTSASIDEARKQKDIQQALLTQIERQVETDVQTAIYGIQSSLVKIEAMRTSVKAYALTLKAKHSGFKSGIFTSIDVLDAESKLYFAKKQLSASLYQLILHYLKLKQVTGGLDQQELTTIEQWLVKG